jgi:hypothetical protein
MVYVFKGKDEKNRWLQKVQEVEIYPSPPIKLINLFIIYYTTLLLLL